MGFTVSTPTLEESDAEALQHYFPERDFVPLMEVLEEKEFTRLRDRLSQQRRELPWVKVEKKYIFEGPRGKETLADLFEGRSQLVLKEA